MQATQQYWTINNHLVKWMLVSSVSSALHRFSAFSLEWFNCVYVVQTQSSNMSYTTQQEQTCNSLIMSQGNGCKGGLGVFCWTKNYLTNPLFFSSCKTSSFVNTFHNHYNHFFRVSTKYVPNPALGLSVRVNHNCLIKAMEMGCLWLKESNISCWYGTYWEQNTNNPPSIAIN